MGLSLLLLLLLLHLVTMMGTFFLPSESAVTLTKDNHSIVFQSTDASFAPKAPSTGICGFLSVANPFNACIPLDHIGEHEKSSALMIKAQYCTASLRFLLVSRGLCTFEMKVRHGQDAGYDAIIVTDNIGRHQLITMAGSKSGIEIPAVFVSKVAGEILAQHANGSRPDCWILPSSYENISWLVMVTSFIFLLGMIAAFAIYFLVQSRRQAHGRGSKQCRGISCQIVKALPTYTYKCEYGIQTIDACAICLEDYVDGASLRVLPCNHRFHCSCIDAWLVNWRGFCPVCKKCVTKDNNATPSEHTSLLNNQVSAGEHPPSEQASLMQAEAAPLHGVSSAIDTGNYSRNGTYIGNSAYLRCNDVAPASIRRLGVSRHLSFQSLLGWNSGGSDPMDSFRASPYFTPPSFFHNSAPNVLLPTETSSSSSSSPSDPRHGAADDVRAFVYNSGDQFKRLSKCKGLRESICAFN